MKQVSTLGKWITEKYRSQLKFAEKVGAHPTMVSRWLSGREGISPDYQDKIRDDLKYKGPWPREELQGTQEAAQAPAGDFATREDLWTLAGRLEALEKRMETAFEQLRDLYLRGPKESRQGEPPR